MTKKFLWGAILFWAMGVVSCAGPESLQKREEIYGRAVPVIHQSFASPQIWRGQIWKVYLNASDPDGDMKDILCTVDQPGVGVYPVSIIKIGEEDQKEFSGYIYLNTQTFYDKTSSNLTLMVQIEDQAGHYSRQAIFPLSFSAVSQQAPPPKVFKEVELGPIMIPPTSIQDGDVPGFQQGIFFY